MDNCGIIDHDHLKANRHGDRHSDSWNGSVSRRAALVHWRSDNWHGYFQISHRYQRSNAFFLKFSRQIWCCEDLFNV